MPSPPTPGCAFSDQLKSMLWQFCCFAPSTWCAQISGHGSGRQMDFIYIEKGRDCKQLEFRLQSAAVEPHLQLCEILSCQKRN